MRKLVVWMLVGGIVVILFGVGALRVQAVQDGIAQRVDVFAANRFWVLDTGTGSWNALAMLGLDASRLGAILLMHFHSDHIGDLGEFNLQT